jgi:hypothetical protein
MAEVTSSSLVGSTYFFPDLQVKRKVSKNHWRLYSSFVQQPYSNAAALYLAAEAGSEAPPGSRWTVPP